MQHARSDYDLIQDNGAALALAHHILSMEMGTAAGQRARQLARQLLGVSDHGKLSGRVPVHTIDRMRLIPADEPVFLIRGQDVVGADAVRVWANLAEASGAGPDIVAVARAHAEKMAAWPKKKIADLKPRRPPVSDPAAMTPETTPTDEAQARGAGEAVDAALAPAASGSVVVPASASRPAAWSYEFHEFGDIWKRHVILNHPDGSANPPTKYYGSDIRNVTPLYSRAAPPDSARDVAPGETLEAHLLGLIRLARRDHVGRIELRMEDVTVGGGPAGNWSLSLVSDDAPPARVEGDGLAERAAERIVQEVCELPDRTSPEDWPEALLVTGQELHEIVAETVRALIPATPTVGGTGDQKPAAWSYEFHDFGSVWTRNVILNHPDGNANPPTKHYGSKVRKVTPLFADTAPSGLSQAAGDVLAERRRQVEVEGWTPEHDDDHENGELAGAAAAYAVLRSHVGRLDQPGSAMLETLWPWGCVGWKPTCPRRDLVKAAALILAEIERFDRLSPPSDPARAAAPGGQTGEA